MLKGLRSLWSPAAPSGGGSSEDSAKAKDAAASNGPGGKKDGGSKKKEGRKQQSKQQAKQQQGKGGGSRGGGGRGPKGQRQHDEAKGADSERSGGTGGRKRSHANITSSTDNGKRPVGGGGARLPPPPPAAAPPAFGQGVLTLADFEHKRQRRTRPLDLDRPMPVIVAGRADEKSTIRELLTTPGLPVVDEQTANSLRSADALLAFLEAAVPDSAFLPGPGMYLTDLTTLTEEEEGEKAGPGGAASASAASAAVAAAAPGGGAGGAGAAPRTAPLVKEEVTTPHAGQVSDAGGHVGGHWRRPKELIKRQPGVAPECKTYDAEPEDEAALVELKGRFGDHLTLADLEQLVEELERERFCSSRDKGEVYKQEVRVAAQHTMRARRARLLLDNAQALVTGQASEVSYAEVEAEERRFREAQGEEDPSGGGGSPARKGGRKGGGGRSGRRRSSSDAGGGSGSDEESGMEEEEEEEEEEEGSESESEDEEVAAATARGRGGRRGRSAAAAESESESESESEEEDEEGSYRSGGSSGSCSSSSGSDSGSGSESGASSAARSDRRRADARAEAAAEAAAHAEAAAERRYLHVLESALEPLLARKKTGGRVDRPALARAVLAYWRRRRLEAGPLIRCYHQFPLMPNWQTEEQCAVPYAQPAGPARDRNKQAYEALLNIRYELDKARILADVARRREKLKREWIVTAIEASSHLHQQHHAPAPASQQPPSRPPSRSASKGARGATPPPRPPPLAHTFCDPEHPPLKKACRPLQGMDDEWWLERRLAREVGVPGEPMEEEERKPPPPPPPPPVVDEEESEEEEEESEEDDSSDEDEEDSDEEGSSEEEEEESEEEEDGDESGSDDDGSSSSEEEDDDEEEDGGGGARRGSRGGGAGGKGARGGGGGKKKQPPPRPPAKGGKKKGSGGADAQPKRRGRPPKRKQGNFYHTLPPPPLPLSPAASTLLKQGKAPKGILGRKGRSGKPVNMWSPEEDALLIEGVRRHGPGNWTAIRGTTGLLRNSSQMNQRYARLVKNHHASLRQGVSGLGTTYAQAHQALNGGMPLTADDSTTTAATAAAAVPAASDDAAAAVEEARRERRRERKRQRRRELKAAKEAAAAAAGGGAGAGGGGKKGLRQDGHGGGEGAAAQQQQQQKLCPFPGCDGRGHKSGKFLSHVSLSGCPRAHPGAAGGIGASG